MSKKLLLNNVIDDGGSGGSWEEFFTTGDSLGSLTAIVPIWDGADITTLENGTLIAEIKIVANDSGRNMQLAFRKSSTNTTNSLLNGTYKPTAGEEILIKLYVGDNTAYKVRMDIYKNNALIEEGVNMLTVSAIYGALSRVTPAIGSVKIKRYLV